MKPQKRTADYDEEESRRRPWNSAPRPDGFCDRFGTHDIRSVLGRGVGLEQHQLCLPSRQPHTTSCDDYHADSIIE